MAGYDSKGIYRNDGEGFYDSKGIYRNPGEGFYDAKGIYRNPGEGFYDSNGIYRNPGDGYYDSKGIYQTGSSFSGVSGYSQSSSSSYGGGSYTGGSYVGGAVGFSPFFGTKLISFIMLSTAFCLINPFLYIILTVMYKKNCYLSAKWLVIRRVSRNVLIIHAILLVLYGMALLFNWKL